jgi:putative SOS response-associated peptidase YedK
MIVHIRMCSRLNQMAKLPGLVIDGESKPARRRKTKAKEDTRSKNVFLHNLCPTDYADVLILEAGELIADRMRFGLIPGWAKGSKAEVAKKFRLTFNARSETIFDLASFRTPIKTRRCLIPVQGWHEWPDRTTPYFIHQVDDAPLMFAGIWDSWESPYPEDEESGPVITSMSVVTTPPGRYLSKFHDRCPLILEGEEALAWLSSGLAADDVRALIRPYESDRLEAYQVAPGAVLPKNKSTDALEPISAPVPQEGDEPIKAELDQTPELILF